LFDEITDSVQNGNYPILHIEAHGDEDGLGLSSGENIDWPELSAPLVALNELLRGLLIITVAACSGGHMAITAAQSERAPFLAVLGPSTKIWDNELYADYCQFYFEYDKTRSITKARWAMNAFKTAPQDYYFSTALNIFTQVKLRSNARTETPIEYKERMGQLAQRMAEKNPTIDARELKETLLKKYPNSRAYYQVLWDKFMLIDLYPGNAKIFPFPLDV
jgi:hypothetical protein